MKFKRKPIIETVDAIQWYPPGHSNHIPILDVGPRYRVRCLRNTSDPLPEGAISLGQNMFYFPKEISSYSLKTGNSDQEVYEGAWIVTFSNGERGVMHPEEFEKNFERMMIIPPS